MDFNATDYGRWYRNGFLAGLNRSFRRNNNTANCEVDSLGHKCESMSESPTLGLQNTSGDSCNGCQLRPLEIVAPRIDSYRFSMANLEETQDADLDAILGELCALDSEYDEEISRASSDYSTTKGCNGTGKDIPNKSCSEGSTSIPRTDSPDNDSAFSDTVSLLSSESSASSSASAQCKALKINLLQNQKDPSFQQKADKIKLALERMREASIKKLFIKAFSVDGSSKSLLVDEKMTCGYVTRLLADKNHVTMEPKWAIVEHLPDLYMERVYEDHELLVDNLMLWTRESKNKILFAERQQKISLFQTPEKFLLSDEEQVSTLEHDEHSRQVIIEEFFGQSTVSSNVVPSVSGHRVPPIEGPLYLKSDAKKGWKKYHFVLRPSGLYYFPKEKVKALKELVCLATFDTNEVYVGVNWKKKYKSPTDFCFAIKHPRLQQPKSVKFIKFLCAEDQSTLDKWVAAMRIAKHGRQILENYRILVEELTQDDIDHLAHARSCSMSSIQCKGGAGAGAGAGGVSRGSCSPPQSTAGSSCASDTNCGRHSRTSSSSSSGCLSDGGTASESAFDCEFPMGTIKRKPSMKPNIPLTWMTRQLKEMAEGERECERDGAGASERDGGTLTRRPRHAHDATLKRRHNASIESSGVYSGGGSPASSPPPAPLPPSPYAHYDVTARPDRSPHLACDAFGYASLYERGAELPPPPAPVTPALFSSTLSLESLPPPPPPPPDSDLHSELNISQLSLPPPPPEVVAEQLKPRNPSVDSISKLSDHSSQRSAYSACLLEMQKTLSSTSPRDFAASDDKVTERASSLKKQVNFADAVDGSIKKNKKISFAASCSGSPRKPLPPKRNESTKLSSPKKLADSNSNPPKEFIKDLQKVMRKKWQVAQKCKLEPMTSPHEVLGFREYPLSDNYKEASVSMWVQEHYGCDEPYYENSAGVAGAGAPRAASAAPRAPRRPPPAPPRRDTTRLSTAQHAC